MTKTAKHVRKASIKGSHAKTEVVCDYAIA